MFSYLFLSSISFGLHYFFTERDADRDGIANRSDTCPYEAEDKDGFQDFDGCPDTDNDGDDDLVRRRNLEHLGARLACPDRKAEVGDGLPRIRQATEQNLDHRIHDVLLDLRERAVGRGRFAGAAEHPIEHREGNRRVDLDGAQLVVSWVDATDNVGIAGYTVRLDGGNPAGVAPTPPLTSYGLPAPSPSAPHTVTVTAVDHAGNGTATTERSERVWTLAAEESRSSLAASIVLRGRPDPSTRATIERESWSSPGSARALGLAEAMVNPRAARTRGRPSRSWSTR